jgi:GT2 family glycosyltransferase
MSHLDDTVSGDNTVLGDNTMYGPAWEGDSPPEIAVVVSTYRRASLLGELVAALEAQDLSPNRYEVVVVDNGSADGTWDELRRLVGSTLLRMAVRRLDVNLGPGGGRNRAVALVRAPIVAMTDDDCLPTSGWLTGLVSAMSEEIDVVEGRVVADPEGKDTMGPWDHTLWVTPPTPFFATCNMAYRKEAFEAVGGFDETDTVTSRHGGRHAFGEDALLGWRVLARGGHAAVADEAVVRHRCMPSTYRRFLREHRERSGFPALARESPVVAAWLWHRIFLGRQTAEFDLAVAAVVVAVRSRTPWPLIAALPWLRRRWSDALSRSRGDRSTAAIVAAGLVAADVVSLASLLEGSIRHRRLVL